MRRTTALMSQWKAEEYTGEDIAFDHCKGGYFSVTDDYGLKVIGKTLQDGTPSPVSPVSIQGVKKGATIFCTNDVNTINVVQVPCDLYAGDIWYPMTGKVERWSAFERITENTPVRRNNAADSATHLFYYNQSKYQKNGHKDGGVCTHLPHGRATSVLTSCFSSNSTHNAVFFNLTGILPEYTEEAAKAWFKSQADAGKPVYICYEYTTPVIEQYDPQPISALTGYNHLFQSTSGLQADLQCTMLVRLTIKSQAPK